MPTKSVVQVRDMEWNQQHCGQNSHQIRALVPHNVANYSIIVNKFCCVLLDVSVQIHKLVSTAGGYHSHDKILICRQTRDC